MDKRCEESRLVEAINTAQKFIDELSANLSKELERQRIQAKQIQRLTEERDDLAEKASDAIEQMASESLAFEGRAIQAEQERDAAIFALREISDDTHPATIEDLHGLAQTALKGIYSKGDTP